MKMLKELNHQAHDVHIVFASCRQEHFGYMVYEFSVAVIGPKTKFTIKHQAADIRS